MPKVKLKLGYAMTDLISIRSEKIGSISTIMVTLILLATSLMISFQADEINTMAMEDADPIDIDSNSDFASHPDLDSGTGTSSDPYIFSDLIIDCRTLDVEGISVQYTTRYVTFRNITIYADSSAPGIYIRSLYSGGNYYSIYVTLDNVTVIGGGTHLEMYFPIRVNVNNCNFSNPSGTGNIIHSYYGYYVAFDNTTVDSPNMDIYFEHTSYTYMRRNNCSIRYYTQNRFQYSDFSNNTISLRTIRFYAGYFSYIQGNYLFGKLSNYDVCWLFDCNRIWIANNSFIGGRNGIYVQHPNTYSPVTTTYEWWSSLTFEYNYFNATSERGIYFYWSTNHPYMAYMQIHHNEFIGCGNYAIDLVSHGSPTTKIYRNVFEYNHGSTDTYSSTLAQCRDPWANFRWYDNSVGNFWRDWDKTDQDNDGFMDTGDYPLSSNIGQLDPFPVSNPFFDFDEPEFQILTPVGSQLDNRYVNISWSATDSHTGISMIQIKKGVSSWINVTGRDHHGLYLSPGQHSIDLRAVDRAGLKNSTSINIRIQTQLDPVEIISPLNNDFYDHNEILVQWDMIDEFVPLSLETSIDEEDWIIKDPFTYYTIVIGEGDHDYRMRFTDHYGNQIVKNIALTIDTIDPLLEILHPKPGSVISNSLVKFKWRIEDATEITRTTISIDGGESADVDGTSHTSFLGTGGHSIQIEVEDKGGNIASSSMFFTISKNTSLHITSPILNKPTSSRDHDVKWEYLTELDIFKIQLILDDQNPVDLPVDATSHLVRLSVEGTHDITIKAQDPSGNIFSDTITINLDNTDPSVGFQNPKDGDILNRTEIPIRWSASELGGISGYDLLIDDEVIAKGSLEVEMSVTLSEGPHTITIVAVDLAGNRDEEMITITIDTTPPTLELIYPGDEVVLEPYITLKWEGSDLSGIQRFEYILDERKVIDIGTKESRDIQVSEGHHKLILRAIDLAGNERVISKEFTADLNGPVVKMEKTQSEHINYWIGLVNWNITELVGVKSIDLTVDGTNYSLAIDSRYYIANLPDGFHTISIKVTDIGGRTQSDEMSFFLDRKEPAVEKTTEPSLVVGNSAEIFWEIMENGDDISFMIMMNGEVVLTNTEPLDSVMKFTELLPGEYNVNLTFTDLAGNTKTLQYSFEIEKQNSGNKAAGGSILPLVLGIFLILIIIALILFFVLRKKNDSKEEKRMPELSKRPDKISIGPMPSRPAAPAANRSQPLPQKKPLHVNPDPKVNTSTTDGGYIRPDKKKNSNRVIKDISTTSATTKKDISRERSSPDEDIEEWGKIEDWTEMEEIDEFEEMEDL